MGFLEFKDISKSFPGVKALDGVSFYAESGKVLALMGENGAGKSTLLKAMSGDHKPDTGSIILDGEEMHFTSPNDAIKKGISVIYQERQLMPAMSVAENIFSGDLPANKMGIVNWKKLKKDAKELIDKFGLPIDPDTPVGALPTAYQQMVEIMKAYRRDARVIAFDEPTASLAEAEITILFQLIEQLKKEGKTAILVTHLRAEAEAFADRILRLPAKTE